jgi:predicted amidophosphoribosyltransferase
MTSLRGVVRGGLEAWGELLLPTRCTGCGGVGVGGLPEPVCPACRTRLGPLPGPSCRRCQHPAGPAGAPCPLCADWPSVLVRARSATRFAGTAAALVHALKYEGWERVTPVLVDSMLRTHRAEAEAPTELVVPVPTTPQRLRERGFNVAGLLAAGVSQALGIPWAEALSRPVEGPRQVGLPASQRATNVRGAFVLGGCSEEVLPDRHVLLVDDVLTTGATGAAAAAALACGGVRSVSLLTFARATAGAPGS